MLPFFLILAIAIWVATAAQTYGEKAVGARAAFLHFCELPEIIALVMHEDGSRSAPPGPDHPGIENAVDTA